MSPERGLIGVYELGRVSVLTMSVLTPTAEIRTEGDFDDNDVVFVGSRLVVPVVATGSFTSQVPD